MGVGARKVTAGLSWDDIKSKLETEGSLNKQYDADIDGVVDLTAIPTIPRSNLEYPTENVSFAYLAAINKLTWGDAFGPYSYAFIGTIDSFTDKAVELPGRDNALTCCGRYVDLNNQYINWLNSGGATADHKISEIIAGAITGLAAEAVDIGTNSFHNLKFSISGSTLSSYRDWATTPQISLTNTDLTSGLYGMFLAGGYHSDGTFMAQLLAPSSPLPQAQRILEVEIIGEGTEDDPIRPNFAQLLDKHPEFGDIDKLAVTWGAFDYKGESTMLVVITGDNPYQQGAILKQEEYVKSKNLKVFKPPRDLAEARELHKQIKKDRPDIIAGFHNLAYQTIGAEDIEPPAVADYYDGYTQGIYDLKDLEKVPSWELERTMNRWMKRLEKARVTSEEKDKHMRKLKGVLKK
jgi:hypothetical protein